MEHSPYPVHHTACSQVLAPGQLEALQVILEAEWVTTRTPGSRGVPILSLACLGFPGSPPRGPSPGLGSPDCWSWDGWGGSGEGDRLQKRNGGTWLRGMMLWLLTPLLGTWCPENHLNGPCFFICPKSMMPLTKKRHKPVCREVSPGHKGQGEGHPHSKAFAQGPGTRREGGCTCLGPGPFPLPQRHPQPETQRRPHLLFMIFNER